MQSTEPVQVGGLTAAEQPPWQLPMHATLGAVTSHSASHVPLHCTTTSPPVQCALMSQLAFALHVAWQFACALMSAEQLKSTVNVTVTPAASAAATRVLRT